jgi:FkbM family methyltransferase
MSFEFRKLDLGEKKQIQMQTFDLVSGEVGDLGPCAYWIFKGRPDTMDEFIVSETILNDIYRIKEAEKVLGHRLKTIVDLGAHIGGFSRFATIAHPEAQIYAYEAYEENYDLLKINAGSVQNIQVNNIIACGSRPPTGFIKDEEEKDGTFGPVKNTGGGKVVFDEAGKAPLNSTTLKKIMETNDLSNVDFLKMDIEGSEFEVLKHAKEDGSLSKVKYLACELHINPVRGRDFKTFMDCLEDFSHIEIVHNKKKNHRMVFAKQ